MLEGLIENYGAIAIFIGAALEGETAAFLGGVLAHRHLMSYWQVALAACLGSFAADQFFFLAGRRARHAAWVRRAAGSPLMARATALLEAHPVGFILAFRFLYGMRAISPVAVGLSKVPALRFLILNAIAAIMWGLAVTMIGYLFGNGVEALFGRLHLHVHILIALAVAVCLAALAAVLSRHLIGRS